MKPEKDMYDKLLKMSVGDCGINIKDIVLLYRDEINGEFWKLEEGNRITILVRNDSPGKDLWSNYDFRYGLMWVEPFLAGIYENNRNRILG